MFAVLLLCVLRDNLCLTLAMGCAHMDDHRACRVTSVGFQSGMLVRTPSKSVILSACVDDIKIGWKVTKH